MAAIHQLYPVAGVAGDRITVRGAGFDTVAPERNLVTIGGGNAVVTVVSAEELTVTVPVGVVGPVDVRVSADAGVTWAVLVKGFYRLFAPAVMVAENLLQGAPRAVFVDGRPVGFTDEPVRLAHDVGFTEAEVEQEVGAVKLFKTHERWRLSLSLAEISLENLQLAFEGAAIVADGDLRTLALGGLAAAVEHSLLVQGPGPAGKLRDLYAYRAVIEEHAPLAIARDAPQRLGLTFRLLPELALPAGQRILRIAEC